MGLKILSCARTISFVLLFFSSQVWYQAINQRIFIDKSKLQRLKCKEGFGAENYFEGNDDA